MLSKIIKLINGSYVVYPGPGAYPDAGFNVTPEYPPATLYGDDFAFSAVEKYAAAHPEILVLQQNQPGPTLDEVQTAKITELKTARNAAESATPFVYDGSSFDYDSLSRERINAAISGATIAAISGVDISTVVAEWTLADNTKRSMTIADWLAFRQAEITRSGSCHTHYNALKADIEAIVEETATTPPTKTEAEAIVAINAIAWA